MISLNIDKIVKICLYLGRLYILFEKKYDFFENSSVPFRHKIKYVTVVFFLIKYSLCFFLTVEIFKYFCSYLIV